MTDGKALKDVIRDSGITIAHIAAKMGCSRNRIYSILAGAECTASEIVLLSEILHLTKEERDYIFLAQNVNNNHVIAQR